MTKILQNTYLVCLNSSFRACYKTDSREKTAHPSYNDMEQLDSQIQVTDNHYLDHNSVHICFPIKIKKNTNSARDIDTELITVNNFFCSFRQRNKGYKVR